MSIEWLGPNRIDAARREPPAGQRKILVFAALLLAAAALSLPAALGPIRLNDSFWIDLVWLEQFARELGHGLAYPRWLPLSHGGLGSPVFYYYPPLAFYLGSAFVLFGLGTFGALVGAFVAANLLSGLGVYLWLKDQCRAPLIGALLFMAAPYHLFNFYLRGAIAEFLATAILPFVLLGIRRMAQAQPGGFAIAAFAYAALAMCHLPLTLLASIFLFAPYVLVSTRGAPSRLRIGGAFAAGIALAAVYLVPAFALEGYRSTSDLWALTYLQPASWSVWNPASWSDATFRAVMLVVASLAIALGSLLVRHRSGWAWLALACTALSVGVLPFIWSLPLLSSVQFPFRLLPVAEIALVTAAMIAPPGRASWPLLGVLFLVMARFITAAQPETAPFGDSVIRAVHPDVPENLPPGERPYSWPSKWALQVAVAHRQPQFDGKVTIDPVFYFPAWEVRCGDRVARTFPDPKTQLLAYEGRGCSRKLVRTTPERVGALVSLAALIALISLSLSPWLLAQRRSRRRGNLPRNT